MSRKFYWRNLPQKDDVNTSVMVLFDPSLDSGAGGYRPLEAGDLAGVGGGTGLESFNVILPSGMSTSGILFPSAFNSTPTVTLALLAPTGQPIVAMSISDKSVSGFYLNTSANLPADGYSVDVIAAP